MTTPAQILEKMRYDLNDLRKMFDETENGESIFTQVTRIDILMISLKVRMERIEDQLSLIIKLLGKHE